MSIYPGYNKSIEYELGQALLLAERTCTGPPANSIVGYSINLPNTSIDFQTLLKILSGSFAIFNIFVALYLIGGHVSHWAVPAEQKQIARVIAFLPIYAIGAFFSIFWYKAEPYIAPVPDYYEGFSIVAIFLLFVAYVSPDESRSDQLFENVAAQQASTTARKGPGKSAGAWFHRTWVFVFQIIPGRIATLIASEALYAATCPLSNKRQRGLLIIEVVQSVNTALAVVAVIRFESRLRSQLRGRHPRLKLWTFKSIVLLELIQGVAFSALASQKTFRPTQYVSYYDMSIGLPQFLISCECFLYAFAYIKAFEFGTYRRMLKEDSQNYPRRGSPLSALGEIVNPTDIIRGTLRMFESAKIMRQSGKMANGHNYTAAGTHGYPVNGETTTEHKMGSDSA